MEFSNSAVVNMQLTIDIKAAEDALSALYTTGGTGMPKGLKAALDLFPTNPADQSFIILLSDGLPNIGLNEENDEAVVRQQVLDLASEAGQRGICVYTIGFGDPSSGTIDESFLQQVASNSGCGSYHSAGNAWELANIYINLRHASTGTTLLADSGSINQDQLLDIDNVQVPVNQSMILFTLNWPGSQLDALLRDPAGVEIDQNYPGAYITLTDTLASIIIQNPQSGVWNVSARGVDVPEGTTTYNAVLSVRPNPVGKEEVVVLPPSNVNFPAALVIVPLMIGGLLAYVFVVSTQRERKHIKAGTAANLHIFSGYGAGRVISLRDNSIIGRSRVSTIYIPDPSVSPGMRVFAFPTVNGSFRIWAVQAAFI